MLPAMPLSRYNEQLKAFSNAPLSLASLLRPFGIACSSVASDYLFIGHLLDELATQWRGHQAVDALDVATVAYELGFDPAGDFLDASPELLLPHSSCALKCR